jgi:pimeloyl-ACP methyl ester carboxylesterase
MNVRRRSFLATTGVLAMSSMAGAQQVAKPKKRATFVLVHGGGHGGWCFKRVSERLRAAGHDVYAPSMTGMGERSHLLRPDIDLDTHIADIVNLLKWEDLTNVILLGHSYGGYVIAGVADQIPASVAHLVCLDTGIPRNGQSLAGVPAVQDEYRHVRTINGVELFLWPETETINKYYGVWNAEDVAWMKQKLTPHPWKCFSQSIHLSNEAALQKIPRTTITRPSGTPTGGPPNPSPVPKAVQRNAQVWEINTGHDMMITAPEAVTGILLDIAKQV